MYRLSLRSTMACKHMMHVPGASESSHSLFTSVQPGTEGNQAHGEGWCNHQYCFHPGQPAVLSMLHRAGCCSCCQASLRILLNLCIFDVAAHASRAAACNFYSAVSASPMQAYQPMYGIMDYASTKVR